MKEEADQFNEHLPAVAAWVGFALSITLAVVRLIEWWSASHVKARLSCSLTSDCFVRMTDAGEIIFTNVILSSSNRPAFLVGVDAVLTRVGMATKAFPLVLVRYGEPKDRGGPINDHFFFSSSPQDIVSPGEAARRVFMFSVELSRNEIARVCDEFSRSSADLALKVKQSVGLADDSAQKALLGEVQSAAREFSVGYMNAVQLEHGQYSLSLVIRYRDVEGYGSREVRECGTRLTMETQANLKAVASKQLELFGMSFVAQRAGAESNAIWPEFSARVTQTRDSADHDNEGVA